MMGLRDSFRFIAKYASCCRLLLWLSRRLRSTSVDLGFNPVRPRSLSPSTHVAPSQYSASVDVPTLSGWAALELAEAVDMMMGSSRPVAGSELLVGLVEEHQPAPSHRAARVC